ncbi:peptidoglycan-binding protein [Timonella sp. A28]|uniref:peptidoglycan-binding protein n=1 Tax=Timonella sp. A28 TaxID=3442640 RepID=UPI003EBBB209
MLARNKPKLSFSESRSRWIIVWLLVCIAVLVVVYFLGTLIGSPWEKAIENSKVQLYSTAIVEEREYGHETESLRGKVKLGNEYSVTPTAHAENKTIVNAVLKKKGDTIRSGELIAKVSGQPLFLLHLDFPLYRSLQGGDQGDDVLEIQRELKRLGLYQGPIDGHYGPSTAESVKKLYQRAGLSLPIVSDEALMAVEAAQDELEEARRTDSISGSGEGDSHERKVERAQKNLQNARMKAVTPIKLEHFWVMPTKTATIVSLARKGTDLAASEEKPLAVLRSGEAQVTVRVDTAGAVDLKKGTKADAKQATDAQMSWPVSVVSIGDFTTQPDEYSGLPGRDITFTFEESDGLENEAEVSIEIKNKNNERKGLAVPLTALREENDRTYVMKLPGNSSDKTPAKEFITVSEINDGYAYFSSSSVQSGDVIQVGAE